MKIERILPTTVDVDQAISYAQLAVQEKLTAKIVGVKFLGGGSFGRAVGVWLDDGSQIVVKFLMTGGILEKEVFDLELLSSACNVKIPKVLFVRKADDVISLDCYAMERIAGKSLLTSFNLLFASKKKRLEIAETVTSALHEIHERKSDKFGDTLNPDCESWLEYYKPFAQAVLDGAEQLFCEKRLSAKVIELMRKAWNNFDYFFADKVDQACLIHGDLNVANIMVDGKGKVSGIIDPLRSAYADREYDLFQLDNMTGKRFYLCKTYVNKYGASQNYRRKLAFYALWNEVYCYITSGVYIGVIMRPMVRNLRRWVRRCPSARK